jgi:hypothetical protein
MLSDRTCFKNVLCPGSSSSGTFSFNIFRVTSKDDPISIDVLAIYAIVAGGIFLALFLIQTRSALIN